jgi:sterol desaturase/sphingolipid hydroxylase (fatty acid hydroxylase superfamily)
MDRFYTLITDHLCVHWILAFACLFIDATLFVLKAKNEYSHEKSLWDKYKMNCGISPHNIVNIAKVILINQLLVSLPVIWFVSDLFPITTISIGIMRRIVTAILTVEILFYSIHRLFHTRRLYRFHKIHHSWVHTAAISTLYSHPVEHLFSNIVPVMLSAWLAGFSFTEARLWHLFALIYTMVCSHGGYIIGGWIDAHNLHHINGNYNFGVTGLLDRVLGTYMYPCELLDRD